MKRLVVDASTLTSGVASRLGGGAPWLLLLALIDFEFEAIVCPKLIQEFSDALGNRYFQERFDARDLDRIVTSVTGVATMYDDLLTSSRYCVTPMTTTWLRSPQRREPRRSSAATRISSTTLGLSRRRSTLGALAGSWGCSTEYLP